MYVLRTSAVAFRAYDADRSGYIDKSELRQMMSAGLVAQGYMIHHSRSMQPFPLSLTFHLRTVVY